MVLTGTITITPADGNADRKKLLKPKITKEYLERYEQWMKQEPQPEWEYPKE